MKDYYTHNQDKMTLDEIRELKIKTFPYLSSDDVCLSMSDRNIVRKELDLNTDYVLSDSDKQSIRDCYYSMRECLSTHDNPSVQNKAYVSLKPVNLKPFYIKPYLTHESEIPKLSEVIKPINDILKKCNKINKSDKISPLATYNKGNGSRDIQNFGCQYILRTSRQLKA